MEHYDLAAGAGYEVALIGELVCFLWEESQKLVFLQPQTGRRATPLHWGRKSHTLRWPSGLTTIYLSCNFMTVDLRQLLIARFLHNISQP